MRPRPRPAVLEIEDVVHGALDFAELERLELKPDDILDFSVNGNPYGPSPAVRAAMSHVLIERYPDREALALRRVLAQHLGINSDRILVGNGSMELVWLIALAFLRPGDPVLILQPTFGEYVRAAKLMGAQLYSCTARPKSHFQINLDIVQQTLQTVTPRLVFICNPNNPTGTSLPGETIASWAAAAPETLFVVDEAYLTFAPQVPSATTVQTDNMLILRSMTKAYALAGIRLGYAVGQPEILNWLHNVAPPWSVNAFAQAAGIAALNDTAHLDQSLRQITQAKTDLQQRLQASGWRPVASETHFFLLPVGAATLYRQALLQQGLLVRDCTSFGLPDYIRIATRQPKDNSRLLTALDAMR